MADIVLLLIAALGGVDAVVEVVDGVGVLADGLGAGPVGVLVAAGGDAGGEGGEGASVTPVAAVVVAVGIAPLWACGGEGGEEGGGCEDLLHRGCLSIYGEGM